MIGRKRKITDKIAYLIFFLATSVAIGITILIIGFVLIQGLRPFLPNNPYGNYSLFQFILGDVWRPDFGVYGIGYMIISTLVATFWAVVLAVPVSLGTSIFVVEFAPKWLSLIIKFFIECLAGIPSVFFGIFAFFTILPIIVKISPYSHGESLLAVILILFAMCLPSMCLIMINTLENINPIYREGSLALGTSKRQTITMVLLPSVRTGLLSAVMIGVARAIGETMAVALVAGNREGGFIHSPFQTVRLLTTNIVLEQSYATELHAQLLWTTAVVLLFFVMIINLVLKQLNQTGGCAK